MQCPNCGASLNGENNCPNCGSEITYLAKEKPRMSNAGIGCLALILIPIIIFVVGIIITAIH